MRNDQVKITPIIINALLIPLIVYLAIKSYLAIDYEAGITYFELIFKYLSRFILVLIYLVIFILINVLKKKQSSVLNLLYFIGLVIIFILAWLRLNNKQYLAFFELAAPPILFYINLKEVGDWWYDSKLMHFVGRIKSKFKKREMKKATREALLGFSFISPWLIGLVVLMLYPIVYSFYLTFTESYYHAATGITSTPVGFKNYIDIVRNQTIMPMLSSYLIKMVVAVPLIVVFSLIIAMLINQPIKGKGIWRTIFFLPVIISSGPILSELTAQGATGLPSIAESGVLEFINNNLGEWIANPLESLLNSLLLVLWYAGVPILIFLAGLQKTDSSIYEAASIDGAGPWERFWKITLPSIKPLISIVIVFVVVNMSLQPEEGSVIIQTRTIMMLDKTVAGTGMLSGYGAAATLSWIYFFLMIVVMGVFIGLISIKRKEPKR
ncbi:MAG TPA: sugar ABC transporter permease [Acholeplasmataceae bacterium]|jgi:ABC-type sugar transport system permease subunit|nr:sugar ABC transporter permease [Acholeplasmataceae bacterium]